MRDKNVECKHRKTYANRGENHTEVINSPSEHKKLMKILLSKQVLLPGKLIKRNCSSNNLKQGKILKHNYNNNNNKKGDWQLLTNFDRVNSRF